jgi:hypothetical protein
MRRGIAGFILLSLLLCSLIPCTVFDECAEDICEDIQIPAEKSDDCAACSPFSFCSPQAGITIGALYAELDPMPGDIPLLMDQYSFAFITAESDRFFKPPRLS